MSYDLRFQTPCNMIIHGVSQAGKTTWVKKLLENANNLLSKGRPKRIILYYSMEQPMYKLMKEQNLIDEMINVNIEKPSLEDIYKKIKPYEKIGGSMLIFDDILTNLGSDFEQVFCNASHHLNASVLFLSQNLFYNQKAYRTMSLNSHYIVTLLNPRDTQQISILAKQFKPNNRNFVIKSFLDATKRPFGYLIFDFNPIANNKIRLRTNIFPEEFPLTVYTENEAE